MDLRAVCLVRAMSGGGFVGVDEFQIANCFLAQRERGRFLCGCPLRTVVPVPT